MATRNEVVSAIRTILEHFATVEQVGDVLTKLHIPTSFYDEAKKPVFSADELLKLWNNNAAGCLPKALVLTAKRRKAAKTAAKQFPDVNQWEKLIIKINHNQWCLGNKPSSNHPHWKANFDFFIKPETMVKMLEGGLDETTYETTNDLDRRSEIRE